MNAKLDRKPIKYPSIISEIKAENHLVVMDYTICHLISLFKIISLSYKCRCAIFVFKMMSLYYGDATWELKGLIAIASDLFLVNGRPTVLE